MNEQISGTWALAVMASVSLSMSLSVIAIGIYIVTTGDRDSSIFKMTGLLALVAGVAADVTMRRTSKLIDRILVAVYQRVFGDNPRNIQLTTVLGSLAIRRAKITRTSSLLLLLSVVFTISFAVLSDSFAWHLITLTLIGFLALLHLAFANFLWRLRNGLYGTTEHESRQIVAFVLENESGVDFSGGLGAKRLEVDEKAADIVERQWELV